MVRSFLNDPNENKEDSIDVEKVKENIEAINAAMLQGLSDADYAKYEIFESDVNVALTIMLYKFKFFRSLFPLENIGTNSANDLS